MSDGQVVIDVVLNTDKARNQYGNFGNNMVNDLNKVDSASKKASVSIGTIAKSIGLVKVAGVAFNVLRNSISGAIERFDTLQKFPKVMQSMGFETEQSHRAMEKMSNSIEGLPTTLNEMVSLTQKFVNITGNLDKSVKISEALNNAMLASGSNSAEAARGIEQYAQMLNNGEVDMQSFRSLNETMGYGLRRIAEEFLGAGANAMDLYASLKRGDHTMDEVNNKIIELGGATGELAELARKNSEGIGTSFSNLQNAATKGLANIIKDLDDLTKKVTNKTIAQHIDSMKYLVNDSFKVMGRAIKTAEPFLKTFVSTMKISNSTAKTLSPVIVGLGTAYVGLKVVDKVNTSLGRARRALDTAKTATDVLKLGVDKLNFAKAKELAGITASTIATKKELEVTLLNNAAVGLRTTLLGLFTKQSTLSGAAIAIMNAATAKLTGSTVAATGATTLMSAAMGVLNGAMTALMAHPIIAALAVLTGTIVLVTKAAKSANKEIIEERKAIESQTESIKENSKVTKDNVRERAYKVSSMEDEISANKSMVDRINELTRTEKASSAGKKEVRESVEELNRLYPELNIQYDESTNKINQNTDAIKSQIDAYSAYDRVSVIQENLKNNTEEFNSAQAEGIIIADKLKKVQDDKSDWMNKNLIEIWETNKAEKALIEQQEANGERQQDLQKEHGLLLEQQVAAQEAATQAQSALIEELGLKYDFLTDSQKQMVDTMKGNYQDLLGAATSFTSDLSYEMDMTGQEFIDFVANNQQIMSNWGDNLATLTKRGANDGFIQQLQSMGPEGAKYAELAVNMTDEQFNKMNELFEGAPKITEDAWKKAYGIENIDPAVTEMVTQSEESIRSQFESSGIPELLQQQGKKIGEDLAAGMEEGKEPLSTATQNLMTSVTEGIGESDFQSKFNEIGQFVPAGLAQGIEESKGDVEGASTGLGNAVDEYVRSALGVQSPSTKMIAVGGYVVQGLALGITQAKGLVQTAVSTLVSGIENTVNNMKINPSASMNTFVSSITNGMSRANAVVNQGANQMRQSFTNLNQVMVTQSNQGMTRYSTSVTQGMNRATQAVNAGNTRMRSQFSSLNSMIASQTQMGMNRFVSVISSGMNRGVSATNSGRSRMNSAISGLSANFYNSGYYASLGLANGIYAGSGSAMAAARSVANRVAATMKSALKINSPSHVTRDEIGRFIPEGVAVGIDRYAHKVDESMEDMAKSVTKKNRFANIKNAIPRLNGLINGDLKPEFAFGVSEGLLAQSKLQPSVNNSTSTKVIENSPQVTMHVTWKGKEDIRRTMEAMGWIVNVDDKGAME